MAADKHARVIGLYDVTVHLQDPAVNWQQVSDAFVKQFLVDNGTNACIQPSYLPERILGNPQPSTPLGMEGTPGLDYLTYGDLYKDASGYHMEANLVRGNDRLQVLKRVQPNFTDLKDAPFQAQMAALNLRFAGSGTRTLADLIQDFEKKQREEHPQDHAIAPQLKVQLAESDRYPLKLKPAEKRDISFTLMDCDGVGDKGAQVEVETITGDVAPSPVVVNGDGGGKFTYTAPRKDATGQIRAAFTYLRGSEHPGNPEVDSIGVKIGADQLSFRTTVDVKIQEAELQHNETHHSEAVYTPYPGSGANCTTAMQPGERCQFAITTLHASATAKWPQGSHTASTSATGNAVEAELIRGANGGTLRLAGPSFAGMSPDQDEEHYIGICVDQEWKPMQFDLSEQEIEHFSSIQKTVSISSPMGVNNCVGSGTLSLSGKP